MEPDLRNSPGNNFTSPLFKITPISKYLALTIFIALPFIGGLVGYKFGIDVKEDTSFSNLGTNDFNQEVIQDNSNQASTTNSEKQKDDDQTTFRDETYGVTFEYPQAKVGLIPDQGKLIRGGLALIETVIDGQPQYSRVQTLTETPEEVSTLRSYEYHIGSINDFSFRNVPAGFAFSYDAAQREIDCAPTVGFENGYDPCDEYGDVKFDKTNSGLDIYKFEVGDGGYVTKSYVVTLPEKGAVISFSTDKTEYYNGWLSGPELDMLIQNIIKTVE